MQDRAVPRDAQDRHHRLLDLGLLGGAPPSERQTRLADRWGQSAGAGSPARQRAYQDPVSIVTATSTSAFASRRPAAVARSMIARNRDRLGAIDARTVARGGLGIGGSSGASCRTSDRRPGRLTPRAKVLQFGNKIAERVGLRRERHLGRQRRHRGSRERCLRRPAAVDRRRCGTGLLRDRGERQRRIPVLSELATRGREQRLVDVRSCAAYPWSRSFGCSRHRQPLYIMIAYHIVISPAEGTLQRMVVEYIRYVVPTRARRRVRARLPRSHKGARAGRALPSPRSLSLCRGSDELRRATGVGFDRRT